MPEIQPTIAGVLLHRLTRELATASCRLSRIRGRIDQLKSISHAFFQTPGDLLLGNHDSHKPPILTLLQAELFLHHTPHPLHRRIPNADD
jgi:hypothetical protein